MRKVINAILFSNLWISLGAVGTTIATYLIIDQSVNFGYISLMFFATLFGYNLQYFSSNTINPQRSAQTSWVVSNKIAIRVLTIISLIITIVLFIYLFISVLWGYALPAILLVVFYKKTKFGTVAFRTIPLLKIFIISFCWMWTCAILPQVLVGSEINWDIAVFEFFFVLIITIPFDVRDYENDKNKLITIPHLIGVNRSYLLSGFFVLVMLLIACYLGYYLIGGFMGLTFILVFLSKKFKSEYYYLLVLDGLLVVFPIFAQ